MDSSQLTAAQADDLAERIGPMLGYVGRLCDRMQKRGWLGSDPLYVDARAAEDKLRRLQLALRELARLRRRAESQERRPWEPGGSVREGR